MVHEPGFFTLTAALVRMAWSRSVAVMFSRSPSASMRKLDRIGNGGLALDHALRCGEFLHQILAAYGNFHRCPLCGWLFDLGFHDRHGPHLALPPSWGHPAFGPSSLAPIYNTAPFTETAPCFSLDCIHVDIYPGVENRVSSLDCEASLHGVVLFGVLQPDALDSKCRRGQGCATGSKEKDD